MVTHSRPWRSRRLQRIRASLNGTVTAFEIAESQGVTAEYVRAVASRYNLPYLHARGKRRGRAPGTAPGTIAQDKVLTVKQLLGRNDMIAKRLKGGESLGALASEYNVSRERIRQIGLGYGIKASFMQTRHAERLAALAANTERREAKRQRDRELFEHVRVLVMGGASIRGACVSLGMSQSDINRIAKRYPELGKLTMHGRWVRARARAKKKK